MAFVPPAPLSWRLFRSLVRTEVQFFAPMPPPPGIDILKRNNMPAAQPDAVNLRRSTILIDLRRDEDSLLAEMDARCRKGLRRAEREGVRVERFTGLTAEIWRDFTAAFAGLTARKAKADGLAMGQIHELVRTDRFALSASFAEDGTALSWHAYIVSGAVARLHSTVSRMDPERGTEWNNMVGRAHRLHHWRDMLGFKADGIETYDMGGVYRGSEDAEQINIARFKSCFGGGFADTFDAVLPLTAKGRLVQRLRRLILGEVAPEPETVSLEQPAPQIR